jgi:hypothetical protein
MEFFGGTSSQVAETHVSEKSLALIGNASGQDAEGAINCSEAFSIRRLEGRRSQWWVLLWICGQDSAPVNEGKSLEMESGDVTGKRLLLLNRLHLRA